MLEGAGAARLSDVDDVGVAIVPEMMVVADFAGAFVLAPVLRESEFLGFLRG